MSDVDDVIQILRVVWDQTCRERDDAEARVEELLQAFAYEARVVEAQTLDVRALAKGRRQILVEQVQRMRRVALGAERPRVPGTWDRTPWRDRVAADLGVSCGATEETP